MKRNNFIKTLGLSILGGTTLVACSNQKDQKDSHKDRVATHSGMIVHSVYFWLKPDLTEEEHADFMNFLEELKKVPGIYDYKVAKPALTTPRAVVDNSFSYHWIAVFKSLDDLNIYEKHPDHLAASEKYNKYWVKVEVKDSVLS